MSDPTEPRYLPPNTEALADGEVHPTPAPTELRPYICRHNETFPGHWCSDMALWAEVIDPTEPRPAASPGEADLRALSDAGTPGPWSPDAEYVVGQVPGGRPGGEVIGCMRPTANKPTPGRADAALAAAAVNHLRASLLGSRDDDQRGEVKRLRDAWGASHARMERLVLDARRERDAEKARADAAEEALAGVRALCDEADTRQGGWRNIVTTGDLRALLPTDTTEGGTDG